MKQPQHSDAAAAQGTGRPPEYVVVLWVNAQLRDRIQRTGLSLDEALQAQGQRTREPDRAPVPDLEAEP